MLRLRAENELFDDAFISLNTCSMATRIEVPGYQ